MVRKITSAYILQLLCFIVLTFFVKGIISFGITRTMPLDAVNRLTIGRLNIDVEEVIGCFKLDHEFNVATMTDDQRHLFHVIIPQVIREKDKEDENFLGDFLQWCTAQSVR